MLNSLSLLHGTYAEVPNGTSGYVFRSVPFGAKHLDWAIDVVMKRDTSRRDSQLLNGAISL